MQTVLQTSLSPSGKYAAHRGTGTRGTVATEGPLPISSLLSPHPTVPQCQPHCFLTPFLAADVPDGWCHSFLWSLKENPDSFSTLSSGHYRLMRVDTSDDTDLPWGRELRVGPRAWPSALYIVGTNVCLSNSSNCFSPHPLGATDMK